MCCPPRHIKYFIMLQMFLTGLFKWQVGCALQKSASLIPFYKIRRQDIPAEYLVATQEAGKFAHTYGSYRDVTTPNQGDKTKKKRRTTPKFFSRSHYCDYWARPCLHAYVTGKLCARTVYYTYQTFENYCLMEFVNCRENYEMWQVVYMGACFNVPVVKDFMHYVYHNDGFLDNYYVVEDKFNA